MSEDTEHTMTFTYSGRWMVDAKVSEGSDPEYGDAYNKRVKEFKSAECSCGKSFLEHRKAEDHLKDVRDGAG